MFCFGQHKYEITPMTARVRKKVLSHIANRWRDFKARLTRLYVFGKRQDDTPCAMYKISEEQWMQFRAQRESGEWQVCFLYLFIVIVVIHLTFKVIK